SPAPVERAEEDEDDFALTTKLEPRMAAAMLPRPLPRAPEPSNPEPPPSQGGFVITEELADHAPPLSPYPGAEGAPGYCAAYDVPELVRRGILLQPMAQPGYPPTPASHETPMGGGTERMLPNQVAMYSPRLVAARMDAQTQRKRMWIAVILGVW